MIPSDFLPLANHLWQSTVFAAITGLLTLLLRKNGAHTRYSLWLVASAKFLIPFSLFVAVGSQFGSHAAIAPAISNVPLIIEQVHEPFGLAVSLKSAPSAHEPRTVSFLLPAAVVLWATGSLVLVFSWWRHWRIQRLALRAASPLPMPIGVQALSSSSFFEPGVFGLFHPVLLLPDGIQDHLSRAEFQAILTHELTHIRRRDNLATAMHMVVETVFWFHPLVWWLGCRLIEERERACDEEVLRSGSAREAYAEGILKICELYLRSPLKCAASVTGANLTERIEAIMNDQPTVELNFVRKTALAIAGILAVAIPVILGVTRAPIRAQAQSRLESETTSTSSPTFEVASLKPSGAPPQGPQLFNLLQGGPGTKDPERITGLRVTLQRFMTVAYGVDFDQIQGPAWTGEERFELIAKVPPGATRDQVKLMLQDLLAERFKLILHHVSKSLPVYELKIAAGGPKFRETIRSDLRPSRLDDPAMPLDQDGFPQLPPGVYGSANTVVNGITRMTVRGMPVSFLASQLAVQFGTGGSNTFAMGHIVDKTGLTGKYDFNLEYAGAFGPGGALSLPAGPDEPSGGLPIATALDKQLGLKLIKNTAPFDVLVIDHAERVPAEN